MKSVITIFAIVLGFANSAYALRSRAIVLEPMRISVNCSTPMGTGFKSEKTFNATSQDGQRVYHLSAELTNNLLGRPVTHLSFTAKIRGAQSYHVYLNGYANPGRNEMSGVLGTQDNLPFSVGNPMATFVPMGPINCTITR